MTAQKELVTYPAQKELVTYPNDVTLIFADNVTTKLVASLSEKAVYVYFRDGFMQTFNLTAALPENGVPDFILQAALQGIINRIRTNINNFKTLTEIKEKVAELFNLFHNGELFQRLKPEEATTKTVKLTNTQKAVALVRADISPEYAHWLLVDDIEVIKEIKTYWKSLTKQEKTNLRKRQDVLIKLRELTMSDMLLPSF